MTKGVTDMDPEVVYRRLTDLVDELLYADIDAENEQATELADLIDALDNWLKQKGALPKAWRR